MKNLLLISLLVFAAAFNQVNAQCTTCTPVNCAAQKPQGGLCSPMPDDTVGSPYDAVISFYMPKILRDTTTLAQCSGCSYVELHKIRITSITGLPTGVSFTANNSNNTYDVWAGDSLGCVTFCGTPVSPGTYIIVVNLAADVTAVGIPIVGSQSLTGQPQTYRDTIEIFPGTSACPLSFTLGSGACIPTSCNSLSVDLDATLTNTHCANLISYSWDLGNGTTSVAKTPGVVNYNTPDTFTIKLTTTYYTYRVKNVTAELTGGWTGDVEETTSGFPVYAKPDPYIVIPAFTLNTTGTGTDNVESLTFSNLNLLVAESACADPLEIQAWDEDTGLPQHTNPLGSQDDNCGSNYVTFTGTGGTVTGSSTNSNVSVDYDTVATNSVPESFDIIVYPPTPVPVIVTAKDSMCNGDSTLLTLTPAVPGYAIKWFLNDTTELPVTDSAFYVSVGGSYTAKIINTVTGCTETSAAQIVGVGNAAPSFLSLGFTGTQIYTNPGPSGDFAVDWYFNGNLVAGQNGRFLPYYGAGEYYAEMYNKDYSQCRITAGPDSFAVTSVIDLTDNSIYGVKVFPNPNNGKFTLNFTTEETQNVAITLTNTIGQVVYNRTYTGFTGNFNQELDLSGFSKGVYVATIETQHGKHNSRVVVQ